MKKLVIVSMITVLCFCLSMPSIALAGSKQRHRWEGVAIGVGAAIVGSAIINSHHPPRRDVYVHHHRPSCPPPRYECNECCPRHGRWETRKIWVPPVYERVWNPGHYNRRHDWVPGCWIQVEKEPGYWTEERVWVSYR